MIRTRVLPALWPALIGALYGLGLVCPVLYAVSVGAVGATVWACLLTAAVCAVAGVGGRVRLAALGLGGAVALGYLLLGDGFARVGGMLGAAIHLVRGDVGPLIVYANEAAIVSAVLLTALGCSLARQSGGFFPALSLVIAVLLILWFTGGGDGIWLFAPAVIALCALYGRSVSEDTPYARILAGAAIAVALALSMTPMLHVTSRTLENFADRVRNYITDTFFFSEQRRVYSIKSDGFIPLENRLGGPVDIEERPVMTVETSKVLLLRGAVMNHYNGLNWVDTLSTRRYLYADLLHRGIRADLMDENRPPVVLRSGAMFDTIDVKVMMHTDGASTLFVPLRAEALTTPMALVPYFNASSEIFITRDLMAGDVYTFSAAVISASDPELPALLAQAAAGGEARDMSNYLEVPDVVADDVRALTAQVTAPSETALEKALAIRNHLRANYAYTLKPDTPPDNQDFVSHFLLRGKGGYCTYFASAMAVMGRLAGLPTRYVEGYLVEPSGGIALVTTKKAHAWAEVYFDGFGWIAFDATPSDGSGSGSPRPDDQSPGRGEEERESTSEGDDEQAPAEPSPSPSPIGEDGENPDESPENEPDDSTGGDPPQGDGEPEPTPTPSPGPDEPDPIPDPGSDPDDDPLLDNRDKRNGRWLVWLMTLLVALAAAARAVWMQPDNAAARQCRNDSERLMLWYRAVLGVLGAAGMAARPHETPVQHFARIGDQVREACDLIPVADAVTHVGYGRFGASPAQVAETRAAYQALLRHVSIPARARWLVTRWIKGIGSVERVP